jgi:hypothetical protein
VISASVVLSMNFAVPEKDTIPARGPSPPTPSSTSSAAAMPGMPPAGTEVCTISTPVTRALKPSASIEPPAVTNSSWRSRPSVQA